jgi:hypothetical protein
MIIANLYPECNSGAAIRLGVTAHPPEIQLLGASAAPGVVKARLGDGERVIVTDATDVDLLSGAERRRLWHDAIAARKQCARRRARGGGGAE